MIQKKYQEEPIFQERENAPYGNNGAEMKNMSGDDNEINKEQNSKREGDAQPVVNFNISSDDTGNKVE